MHAIALSRNSPTSAYEIPEIEHWEYVNRLSLGICENGSRRLDELINELRRLSRLKADWDGQNSEAANPKSIELAIRVVEQLGQSFPDDITRLPDYASLSPNGIPVLSWDRDERLFEVEFRLNQEIFIVDLDRISRKSKTKRLAIQ